MNDSTGPHMEIISVTSTDARHGPSVILTECKPAAFIRNLAKEEELALSHCGETCCVETGYPNIHTCIVKNAFEKHKIACCGFRTLIIPLPFFDDSHMFEERTRFRTCGEIVCKTSRCYVHACHYLKESDTHDLLNDIKLATGLTELPRMRPFIAETCDPTIWKCVWHDEECSCPATSAYDIYYL
jgi:hypothetical protein